MRAMFDTLMPFGHSASQASVFVQEPNPSLSICATIFSTLILRSGCPCGNNASWEIFALTNNMADAFLHAATQAPHPIQAAASKALSALVLGTGISFASGMPPVLTEI